MGPMSPFLIHDWLMTGWVLSRDSTVAISTVRSWHIVLSIEDSISQLFSSSSCFYFPVTLHNFPQASRWWSVQMSYLELSLQPSFCLRTLSSYEALHSTSFTAEGHYICRSVYPGIKINSRKMELPQYKTTDFKTVRGRARRCATRYSQRQMSFKQDLGHSENRANNQQKTGLREKKK